MFEEGARLKAKHGPEKVFDFSLGNPDVPPPAEFKKVLKEMVNDEYLGHGYTPNNGYPHVRQAVADYLSTLHQVKIAPDLIIMTVGAAGALNDAFGAVLNPGDAPDRRLHLVRSHHPGKRHAQHRRHRCFGGDSGARRIPQCSRTRAADGLAHERAELLRHSARLRLLPGHQRPIPFPLPRTDRAPHSRSKRRCTPAGSSPADASARRSAKRSDVFAERDLDTHPPLVKRRPSKDTRTRATTILDERIAKG